jgi:NAD(P)-dependent dehydrogenase (short-subunit alcohol dehydrogenase family)
MSSSTLTSTPLVWLITGQFFPYSSYLGRTTDLTHTYHNAHTPGTSSGFGNCLVASVLARGDRVIATARSLERLSHLQAQGNPNLCVRQLDVTAGAAAIAAVVAEAAGVWGRLDVVVNNAGAGYPGLLEEGGCVLASPRSLIEECVKSKRRSDLLRKQFAVNFFGVMDVCAASLPFLRAQRSGTIVVVGSRSAWKPEIPVRLQCSSAVCRILNLPRPSSRDSVRYMHNTK